MTRPRPTGPVQGRRLPVLCCGLLLLACVACVHRYTLPEDAGPVAWAATPSTVFVPLPEDGQDHRPRTYRGSGEQVLDEVARQLRGRGWTVLEGETMSVPDAIRTAAHAGAELVVYPAITLWSDRATEWSGIPDRIDLVISIFDASTGELVDRREIGAASRWATFGGDHPQDLLPELIRRWASDVAG